MKEAPQVFSGFCPIEPVPKGRPRFTKNGHAYTAEVTRSYEDAVRAWFIKSYGLNITPMSGNLYAELEFVLPRPKNAAKSKIWSNTKPDLDNFTKAFLDAMDFKRTHQKIALGVIENDSRIAYLSATKRYVTEGEQTGTRFLIEDCSRKAIVYENLSEKMTSVLNCGHLMLSVAELEKIRPVKETEVVYLFAGGSADVDAIEKLCDKKFPNAESLVVI